MYRSIIVARIRPNMQESVAKVFAESDATSLPHDLGVVRRSLYSLNDVYLHVIDMTNEPGETLRKAAKMPGFKEISLNLRPYVHAYDEENWRTPQDALAKEFYQWEAPAR
jgi:cyclase